jgi:hypothetical protein
MAESDAPMAGGYSALSPAHVGGRRRRSSKKLRLVKKKTVRRMLAKKGLKMRGGAEPDTKDEAAVMDSMGGRRRRSRSRKSRRGFLGKLGF